MYLAVWNPFAYLKSSHLPHKYLSLATYTTSHLLKTKPLPLGSPALLPAKLCCPTSTAKVCLFPYSLLGWPYFLQVTWNTKTDFFTQETVIQRLDGMLPLCYVEFPNSSAIIIRQQTLKDAKLRQITSPVVLSDIL